MFTAKEVEYLRHIVSNKVIRTNKQQSVIRDPKKVDAAMNHAESKSILEVRSFLGLEGYYCQFIKDFMDKAKPLTELVGKYKPFDWNEPQESVFRDLTTALCTEPVLKYPDYTRSIGLNTD